MFTPISTTTNQNPGRQRQSDATTMPETKDLLQQRAIHASSHRRSSLTGAQKKSFSAIRS